MLERTVFTIILAYLLIVQLFNARLMKPMIKALGRERLYDETIKSAWIFSLLLVALVFLFRVPPESVGLGFAVTVEDIGKWRYFVISCLVIFLLLILYLLMKTSFNLKRFMSRYYQSEIERLLLPRTKKEEKAWTAVSITAGVTEEFIFRGVLLYTLGLYADLSILWLSILGGAIFGLAHAYQGIRGILITGLLGWTFGYLYLTIGVLWPLMLIHILLDLIAGPVYVSDSETG